MRFDVTILGSSSATPIYNRNPSSQLLNVNERYFLIDCGEGTQVQLIKNGIKAQRIDHILISHLHGDHYLGLVGLLSSLHLNGRTKPMYLFGPPELLEILSIQFKYSETQLRYSLIFKPTQAISTEQIFENNDLIIKSFVLDHRIPCTGFKFSEKKRSRRIIKEKFDELKIPIDLIPELKRGGTFTDKSGKIHPADELTSPSPEPRSYAYCSDTLCSWKYIDEIKGVDTLYHESTFMHDMLNRATETFHTTSLQAGEIAEKAGVKQLLLGHFSARYRELAPLLDECKTVFENAKLATEGQTFEV